MSHLAHTLTVWEDVLVQLRRMSMSWKGNPLSKRDADTFTEAIVMCALHLIDLSQRYGGIGTEREIIAWAKFSASLDVSLIGSFLSDAIVLLRHVVEPCSYSWFKRQLSKNYPFVGQFLSPIRGSLAEFLSNPSPRGFYVCYQFLSFLTHLSLLDLAIDLEGEYEEMECYLQSLTYPEDILKGMNKIMRGWLDGFSITEETYNPKHGPGAVAELSAAGTTLEKYLFLGTDPLLEYVLSKHVGTSSQSYYPFLPNKWERCSKVVFVPKSMKTRRTISKEPATLMYHQQAVWHSLSQFLSGHSFLSRHIDLKRQEKNASLAIRSSSDQKFATIDLSSASDTVTTRLVKAVFRGTALYPFLVALRSRIAELPSGKRIEIAKFAPMGSALCFPVESLIFACAVEYAVRHTSVHRERSFSQWRVYGDDIIIADALFSDVMQILLSLGFILNPAKSFSSPYRFRESCGGEGYDGVNVTPMKISRGFYSAGGRVTPHHAALFSGLIDMANQAYTYDFSLLRIWIIRILLNNPLGPPLFSWEGQGALISLMPDNYRAPRRLNWDPIKRLVPRPSYQRLEIRVVMSVPSTLERVGDARLEQARLFETLRLSHLREGDMFQPEHRIQVLSGTGDNVLKKVWVEIPH